MASGNRSFTASLSSQSIIVGVVIVDAVTTLKHPLVSSSRLSLYHPIPFPCFLLSQQTPLVYRHTETKNHHPLHPRQSKSQKQIKGKTLLTFITYICTNWSPSNIIQNKTTMSPLLLPLLLLLHMITGAESVHLRPGYYSGTCPEAENIVRDVMKKAFAREPRSLASVMRFQFHDCFVNGCDASMLLDDTPTMPGEKLSLSNINSLRSYEVVDEVKQALEEVCPGVVSCADIIIMASRDAVVLTGGPDWQVKLGRLDSLTASQEASDNVMPSPRANASFLIDLFARFNLSVKDLVALSGSHSIGQGRCFSIMFRLYNQSGTGMPDPAFEPKYREKLNKICPSNVDQNVTGDLDATPIIFDNQYFKDLASGRGFLNSDQTLFTFPQTRSFVKHFSIDQDEFFKAFVEGMIKMGDLQIEQPGEIRENCRVANRRAVNTF